MATPSKIAPQPGPKPGEPAFQMKIEPDKYLNFKWKPAQPIIMEVKIENTTKARQTFKIKCTDNEIFRVRPPLGFVAAGESAKIKITCNSKTLPDNDRHLFAFYHFKSDEQKLTARQIWTNDAKPEGVTRIVVTFEDATGGDKKDEKKGEKKEEKKESKEKDKEKKEKDEPKKKDEEKKKDEDKKKDEEKKDKEDKEEKKDEKKKEKEEKKEEKEEEGKKKEEDEKKDEEKKDDKKEKK